MKIVDVKSAVMGTAWRNMTFVRVITDDGLEGVGEVRMLNHTDALLGYFAEAVPNHVLGHDHSNIEDLVRRLYLNDYARAGEIAMSAIATIELACWDIIGQMLGQPVYKLLGGAVRDKIKAYANGWYTVERTPQEFHAAAKRVLEKGYHALKFDPFGAGFYEIDRSEKLRAIELVEAVRNAVGPDVEILIEMHGRFNPATAIEMARELEPFKPSWVEEPVPPENLAALKKASEKITIPLATGERIHTRYEYRQLFELQAADIIQPDITHFGGLLETKKSFESTHNNGFSSTCLPRTGITARLCRHPRPKARKCLTNTECLAMNRVMKNEKRGLYVQEQTGRFLISGEKMFGTSRRIPEHPLPCSGMKCIRRVVGEQPWRR